MIATCYSTLALHFIDQYKINCVKTSCDLSWLPWSKTKLVCRKCDLSSSLLNLETYNTEDDKDANPNCTWNESKLHWKSSFNAPTPTHDIPHCLASTCTWQVPGDFLWKKKLLWLLMHPYRINYTLLFGELSP